MLIQLSKAYHIQTICVFIIISLNLHDCYFTLLRKPVIFSAVTNILNSSLRNEKYLETTFYKLGQGKELYNQVFF